MAFQLPTTTTMPPNFGGINTALQQQQGQQQLAQGIQQQLPPSGTPSPWTMQQFGNNMMQGIAPQQAPPQGGLPPATTPPPTSWGRPVSNLPGAPQGYLNRGVGMGNPQVGPTIRGNGMPNPTQPAPMMGSNPQFNRIR